MAPATGTTGGNDFLVDFDAQKGWYACTIEMVPCKSSAMLKSNDGAALTATVKAKLATGGETKAGKNDLATVEAA